MKLPFLLCLLFIFCSLAAPAQVYQDVQVLLANEDVDVNPGKVLLNEQTVPILKKYFRRDSSLNINTKELKENPFLDTTFIAAQTASASSLGSLPAARTFLGSLGGTDVTFIADGTARFLIKRAKEELLISFFSNLKDSKLPEFAIMFPNTKILVDHFNPWEYANILNTLREALEKDLRSLMGNIPRLGSLKPEDYEGNVKTRVQALRDFFAADEGLVLKSALQIGNGLITNQKIPDIIHTITSNTYLKGLSSLTPKDQDILTAVDLLSLSIRSDVYGEHYIAPAELAKLFDNGLSQRLYLGLMYQQLGNAGIKLKSDKQSLLANANVFIISLVKNAKDVESAFQQLSDARAHGESDLSKYWGAAFYSANQFFHSIDLKKLDPAGHLPTGIGKAIEISTNTLEIAQDIANRNYNAAIMGSLGLLNKYVLVAKSDGSVLDNFLVKYGSFAANVTRAKDADEIEAAIESIALPAGSATIKKQTSFNIALNAYLGGFFGNEYLGEKKTGQWRPISGFYAPIGVTFSWGLNKNGDWHVLNFLTRGASISTHINLVDIGAIAAYRFSDTSTATLPKVTLQNIIAPGLGIVYGFPKIPVSVGWSWQLGPALREINASEKVVSEGLNSRWQFFLGIDIPLLNLYTQSKKSY